MSQPASINDYGQVVGRGNAAVFTPDSPNASTGSIIQLGTSTSSGFSINNRGQVSGNYIRQDSRNIPFLWTPDTPNGTTGTRVDVTGFGDNVQTNGHFINDHGQVAGNRFFIGESYVWTPSSPNGTSGSVTRVSQSSASDLNNYGQLVGFLRGTSPEAFVWTPDSRNGTSGTVTRLGVVPGNFSSEASAINNHGVVVGVHHLHDGTAYGFRWTPQTPNGTSGSMEVITPLGLRTLHINDLNDAGQAVGSYFDPSISNAVAFLYDPRFGFLDLNQLLHNAPAGMHLTDATGINEVGQIIGSAVFDPDNPDALYQSILLTPVPEPAHLAALAFIPSLFARRRRASATRKPALR